MKVKFNGKEMNVDEGVSLAQFISQQNLPAIGIASAINGKMVRKTDWDATLLKEDDEILIISAVCGG